MEETTLANFKKHFLANSALISFRYVAVAGIGLALSVAFAHLSTKQIFGQYQFMLSVLAMLSVVSLPGLNIAALKLVAEGKSGAVSQTVRLSFLWGILAIPLLVGYGTYILLRGSMDSTIGWVFIFFGGLFPFLNAPNTWYVHYEGRLVFLPVVIRTICASILMAVLLFLGLWNQWSLFSLISIWFFVSTLTGWFFYWEVRRKELRSRREVGILDVSYGIRVSFQKFSVGLTESIPVIAISFFLGFEAVANFQVASVFVGAVSGLLGALTAMALPVIFSNTDEHQGTLLLYSGLSGIVASIGYAILVEILFLAIYGDQYRESFDLARLLVFLPCLISLRMFLVNMFTARGENVRIILVYVLANAVAILFFLATFGRMSFVWSVGAYLYMLNGILLLLLAGAYFLKGTTASGDNHR